jgi:hypothetical protein
MPRGRRIEPTTQYLNVDVEVLSRSPLARLVSALGPKVFVHYCGPLRRSYLAHFSLASSHGRSADTVSRQLAVLIARLSASERKLWLGARSRTFDVGVQGGRAPFSHTLLLSEGTVARLAALNVRLVYTSYGAQVPPKFPGRRQPAPGAA